MSCCNYGYFSLQKTAKNHFCIIVRTLQVSYIIEVVYELIAVSVRMEISIFPLCDNRASAIMSNYQKRAGAVTHTQSQRNANSVRDFYHKKTTKAAASLR
jgi:hypothetical protein